MVKLTVPCCRRLCPEMKIVEHWVMEQSARWNGGSFRFCLVKSYFLQTGSSACFLNYYFTQDGTFVKDS